MRERDEHDQLHRMERKLDQLLKGQKHLMATEAELLTLLAQANDETNSISTALQKLLDAEPSISPTTMAAAQALVDRLTAVAAETPTPKP